MKAVFIQQAGYVSDDALPEDVCDEDVTVYLTPVNVPEQTTELVVELRGGLRLTIDLDLSGVDELGDLFTEARQNWPTEEE